MLNIKRSGVENLFNKIVVPIMNNPEQQKECDDSAEMYLSHEMAIKLYQHLIKEPLAVRVMPIIKSNVTTGYNEGEREIRANVQFRKFTFCGDCPNFSQEGFNGGFCTKMREIVHITDGCTIAGDEDELY